MREMRMMWFTLLIECMEVQWDKFIIERLPVRLRTELMKAVCLAVTLPVVQIYNEFMVWKKRMDIKAGGSPQVCMLQKIVKDTLDIDLIISEGNGKPVDFIIHTSFTDVDKERQLFALLDRYKLAGKSYMYKNAEVEYSQQWSGFICERQTVVTQWRGYVCEIKNRPVNYAYCSYSNNRVYVRMQFAPESDLDIEFSVSGMDENWEPFNYSEIVRVPKRASGQMSTAWNHKVAPVNAFPTPEEDNTYLYKAQWQ